MTFAAAAELILRDERREMTTAEITELALTRGLISSRGKTPVATMSAALYTRPDSSHVRRVFVPGEQRAMRGTVRWTYADPEAA
jgi:hypothetical protein